MFRPFSDLLTGIPDMPEPVNSAIDNVRFSLHGLIHELQTYATSYQGEEFRFGGSLLLLLPIMKVFEVFVDKPNFGEESAIWRTEMEGIWERIPGSRKLLLPHQ